MAKILLFISVLFVFFLPCRAEKVIHIHKDLCRLDLIEGCDTICSFPVSVGINKGQKTKEGDNKTPEGTFWVWMIQDSRKWDYDFGDGAGKRKGAYGDWFIRLKCPMSDHIGIHGTCFPESVGYRSSRGCVRLRNEDLAILRQHVKYKMKVIIYPDK